MERRGFIRSFIKKIDVDYPHATVEYTVPLPEKNKDSASNFEVLSLVQSGVPNMRGWWNADTIFIFYLDANALIARKPHLHHALLACEWWHEYPLFQDYL